MHRCISLHVIISLVLSLLALALVLALALALTHSSHSSQATTGNSALGGWAARSLGWSLAGWLAGRAGGRALAPTTTAETRVLKGTVISIYGDRGAPCICENAVL